MARYSLKSKELLIIRNEMVQILELGKKIYQIGMKILFKGSGPKNMEIFSRLLQLRGGVASAIRICSIFFYKTV